MKYVILQGQRRDVVARAEELAGKKAVYTRAPRFAFILDGIVMEKDSTVTIEEGVDMGIILQLEAEGIIGKIEETAPESEPIQEEAVPGSEPTLKAEPIQEEATPEAEAVPGSEPTPEAEPIQEEATLEAEAVPESEPTLEAKPIQDEKQYQEAEYRLEKEPIQEAMPTQEEATAQEDATAQEEAPAEDPSQERKHSISLPLGRHTASSIRNLVCSIYSKGALISKATGGMFDASDDLVDALKAESYNTVEEVLEDIGRAEEGALVGVRFADGEIIFDGFPETDDVDKINAWTELCKGISKNAIKQHHVHLRKNEETNEKFAFRTWLTRLGMNGSDLKKVRSILYENLSGHTAFRTAADEERWKARQAAKRRELRAQKEEERQA